MSADVPTAAARLDTARAVVLPGPGAVVRLPGLLGLLRLEGDGDNDPSHGHGHLARLVEICTEISGSTPCAPGRPLARRLARWLGSLDPGPDLGIVSATENGLALFLHGAVDAVLDGERYSAADSGAWLDRLLPHPGGPVVLLPTDHPALDAHRRAVFDLRGGVVPAGAVLLVPRSGHVPAALVQPGSSVVAPGLRSGPIPRGDISPGPAGDAEPAPVGGPGGDADPGWPGPEPEPVPVGGPGADAEPDADPGGPGPAPERPSGPPPTARPEPAVTSATPAPPTVVEVAPPLLLRPVPAAVRVASILGVDPDEPPRAPLEAGEPRTVPKGPLAPEPAGEPATAMLAPPAGEPSGARAPRGVLVFDDGSRVAVDGDYLLGRMPQVDPRVRRGQLLALPVDDPQAQLSRGHLVLRLDGWEVCATDESRNGTLVAWPAEDSWSRMPPHRPLRLVPGTRVRVGGRTFVFEAP